MSHRIISLAILTIIAARAPAGTLTPPAAPAPTMKTLDEVEARTPIHAEDIPLAITQPGSYYFAENIQYTGEEDGISIYVSGVTIDLNGFTLAGSASDDISASGDGISANSGTSGTIVKNGRIINWDEYGLRLRSNLNRVTNVTANNNFHAGIGLLRGRVENCVASDNGAGGIVFFSNPGSGQCLVSGCLTHNNTGYGIGMGQPGLVVNNSSSGNSVGIYIFKSGTRAENNNIFDNTNDGLGVHPNAEAVVINNTASGNGTDFDIPEASVYGPIINMTGGGVIPAVTSPLANIRY